MRPGDQIWPDWRDAGAYAPLLRAERSAFAWEWLRRDPDYLAAAIDAIRNGCDSSISDVSAARWGLHVFERPDRAVPDARPIWRREILPSVLVVKANECRAGGELFDLARPSAISTLLQSGQGEHLLLSDGFRSIRLDAIEGSFREPARVTFILCGFGEAERSIVPLRQLMALRRTGDFSRRLHPPDARAARHIAMLRVHDALAAGASQREIAELLVPTAELSRWRSAAPSARSYVQRLVRSSRAVSGGGWKALLGSNPATDFPPLRSR